MSEVDLVEPGNLEEEEEGEVVGARLRPAKEEIVEAQGWVSEIYGGKNLFSRCLSKK